MARPSKSDLYGCAILKMALFFPLTERSIEMGNILAGNM